MAKRAGLARRARASVPVPHRVREHGLLAGRDRDPPLDGARVLAPEVVGLLDHLAVAAHVLLDHDRDLALLAVAELDLHRDLALAVGDAPLGELAPLAREIERLAHVERERLALGGVPDAGLARELEVSGGIDLVEAHAPARQPDAETGGRVVPGDG